MYALTALAVAWNCVCNRAVKETEELSVFTAIYVGKCIELKSFQFLDGPWKWTQMKNRLNDKHKLNN